MTKKLQNSFGILLFILFPLGIFILGDITPVYYNNDDFFLKQIASGELTGTPEAHLLHIGYFTGLLLSILYRLFPSVAWYGILLFTYCYLSISLSFYTLSKHLKKAWQKILFALLTCLISFSFLWIHLVQVQYTTITAIVCAASLLHFYLSEDMEKPGSFLKKNLPSLLFFFLALELRDKACIMFLPTFFLVGVAKYIRNKKLFNSLFAYGITLLCILTGVLLVNKLAYSAPEWETFQQYNTSRENVVDYNGYPDYEQYRSHYEALGVTYQSYLSASTRYQLLLDEHIDADFMLEMEALSHNFSINLKSMLQSFLERHITSYLDRPLNLLAYVLYFFTFLLIVLLKKWYALGDLSAVFLGRMVIWAYLLFIDRPMARVTQGIYVTEILLLFGIIFTHELWRVILPARRLAHRIILGLFGGCLLFISVKWGIPNINSIIQYNKSRIEFSENYQEIRNYFYQNSEKLYLLDTNSFSYFTEDIFQETTPSHGNFVLLGSWTANSPWTDSIAVQYGITSYEEAAMTQNNVFFVFMNTEGTDHEYLENYLNSKYPCTSLEICDTFTSSKGTEFNILQTTVP